MTSSWAAARQEKVLYPFNPVGTGATPIATLVSDAAGNLYGTTEYGGVFGYGTAYELTPGPGGTWNEKVLHNFNKNGTDGIGPEASLIFDGSGNLYGTTFSGGTDGVGTVFELSPAEGGNWAEKVLYSFRFNGIDAYYPLGGVIFDAAGNLYGTTIFSGPPYGGTVFELTPSGNNWTEKILYTFGNGTDGQNPQASLIFDTSGNLYGTTEAGGTSGLGMVFELMPSQNGWTEKVLLNFNGANGGNSEAALVFDKSGNLYGTTYGGGAYGYGTVFELMPAQGGNWTEQVLHSFPYNNGVDGGGPNAAVIIDNAGNLYGTTGSFGAFNNKGTVYQLTPGLEGWTENVLFSFNGTDGQNPFAGLVLASGNLFGSTSHGGPNNLGVVFELTPLGNGWAEKTICNFTNAVTDGAEPYAALLPKNGNLYGTTFAGGAYGYGSVFELTPAEGGGWTEKTLHSFNYVVFSNSNDGSYPRGGLGRVNTKR